MWCYGMLCYFQVMLCGVVLYYVMCCCVMNVCVYMWVYVDMYECPYVCVCMYV